MNSTNTVVAETRCSKCDADVRDGSAFCYNCGARVADDSAVNGIEPADAVSPTESSLPAARPAPGMRSARDLRRTKRSFERKPVRIVWEPAGDGPGTQLIVITLAILVFTVVVIVLAFALR